MESFSHHLERQLSFSREATSLNQGGSKVFSWSQGQRYREECWKCVRSFHPAVHQEKVWRRQVQLRDSSVSDWGPLGRSTRRTSSSKYGWGTIRTSGAASSGSSTKAKTLHYQERLDTPTVCGDPVASSSWRASNLTTRGLSSSCLRHSSILSRHKSLR